MTAPRFQLAAFARSYTLPGRPSAGSQAMKDGHRQTGFLLGDDLALFERAMNAQLQIVAENARLKSAPAAGLFTLWSRAFSHLSDACAAVTIASYASTPLLLRAALDCVAAQRSLIAGGFTEYEEWYAGAVSKQGTALAIDIGRFRAASVLAEDKLLGNLYRLLSDLAMPHFGATILLTSPDSGENKIASGFADNTFHLGWAELTLGWALEIAAAQLTTARSTSIFAVSDHAAAAGDSIAADIAAALASQRRCYVEPEGDRLPDGRHGFLIHNFRRTATGQPRRIIL